MQKSGREGGAWRREGEGGGATMKKRGREGCGRVEGEGSVSDACVMASEAHGETGGRHEVSLRGATRLPRDGVRSSRGLITRDHEMGRGHHEVSPRSEASRHLQGPAAASSTHSTPHVATAPRSEPLGRHHMQQPAPHLLCLLHFGCRWWCGWPRRQSERQRLEVDG